MPFVWVPSAESIELVALTTTINRTCTLVFGPASPSAIENLERMRRFSELIAAGIGKPSALAAWILSGQIGAVGS